MQGFLNYHIPVWLRRGRDHGPGLDGDLRWASMPRGAWSQPVVSSFGLPFAVIPLVWFTSRRSIMGSLANRPHHHGPAIIARC